jgi:CRP/FNR family cyclic AMP-dependent transcriptional regulator
VTTSANSAFGTARRQDDPALQTLIDAISTSDAEDGLVAPLTVAQWQALTPYLQSYPLAAGDTLFNAGAQDSTLFFVASGSLSIHVIDSADRLRLAIVRPGSVVGEGSFFSRLPRKATVHATSASQLWALTPVRFTELGHRLPELALAITMAVGNVLGRRLVNRRRRVAAT